MKTDILNRLKYSQGKDAGSASVYDWRIALSLVLRDEMVETWFQSTKETYASSQKRVYYLSMEFLIGRLIEDMISNLGFEDKARAALKAWEAQ